MRDRSGLVDLETILRLEKPDKENFVMMQVTGFGYQKEETAFARVAKGSDWHLEFPTPYTALRVKNFLLVSTIEQGGRMRYVRIKLKE